MISHRKSTEVINITWFGHTSFLLFKKKGHKTDIFPVLQKLTHMSVEFIHCSRAKLSGAQLSSFSGRTVGPRTVGPRGPTVRGPTVHFLRADSWAPDRWAPGLNCPGLNCPGPNCPGPNCPGPNCPGPNSPRTSKPESVSHQDCPPQLLSFFMNWALADKPKWHVWGI